MGLRSHWVRVIFQSRTSLGEYYALIQEKRLVDHTSFYKYFHMSPTKFDELLSYIGAVIARMRRPMSPGESLAVTLRYLVTGDSMQTISFSYRLGHSTVCHINDDTCQAIWEDLSPECLRSIQNSKQFENI